MPKVQFLHGDVLEGGFDLTVLPCSAKGTVSSAARQKIERLGIIMPPVMQLGDVSGLISPDPRISNTKYVVYGASVFNDFSSSDAIHKIGLRLGTITKEHPEITNIESVLLGTGAGRLLDEVSAKAIRDGFEATARPDARLTVFLFGADRLGKVKAFLENPVATLEYGGRVPPAIRETLTRYISENNGKRTAFVIMSFESSKAHDNIISTIREACAKHGIVALRADDKQYADNLLDNVLTYIYGCDFGIAVFERIGGNVYNPNVSFETGYLMGLQKPLLLLKDKTLAQLPTDLVGNLYRVFDFQSPEESLPKQISAWMLDKEFHWKNDKQAPAAGNGR
jgi:hypothetical protein